MTLLDNLPCLVPITILHGRLQIGAMVTVEVLENAILVLETSIASLLRLTFLDGGI